jgi:hypothetical protein
MRFAIAVAALCLTGDVLLCAAEPASEKDEPVKLPPIIVEGSQPKVRTKTGPRWNEEMFLPGFILKLDHPTRTQSFLFAEGDLVRTVFGTKGVLREDGTISAGFRPMRLRWRLEEEWLVFFDEQNRRVEELRLVREGWLSLTAERRSGEVLRFRITKPPKPKPIKIIKS